MRHFADDNYDIEKAIARYEGLPFLLKKANLEVGRADLDPYTPEDQHFRPHPKHDSGPAAAGSPPPPPPGDPNCPYCYGEGCKHCQFDQSPKSPSQWCAKCQGQGCEECNVVMPNPNLNRFESKKKCECWEGYKRVPGTKPCAPGSCEKCDTHSKKSSDLNSQPFANPVPLADAPGTTPGNKPIDEVLENAPSAVGTGQTTSKTAYEYQRSVGPDAAPEPGEYHNPELDALEQRFNEWFETQPFPDEMRMSCLGSFDQAYEIARSNPDFEQLNPEAQFRALIEEVFRLIIGGKFDFNFPPTPNNNPILGKTAAAHTVEEKNNEFFVVEDGGEEAAGPFDSQDEAYARANELNDLENLETEKTHKGDESKPSGGVSLTITMAKALAMKESAIKRKSDSDQDYQRKLNDQNGWYTYVYGLNDQYKAVLDSYGLYNDENCKVDPQTGSVQQPKFYKREKSNGEYFFCLEQPAMIVDGSSWDPGQRQGLVNAGVDPALMGFKPLSDEEAEFFIPNKANMDQYIKNSCWSIKNLSQIGQVPPWRRRSKASSQGDKPSPHAAKAVFNALAGGNEGEAKDLLKQTDCPNGCEVHPEGKCNHGFMSAGRTRVRYLVNNEPFGKKDSDNESVE